MVLRTGLGIDFHRFASGRRLVLGGVEIPHTLGLAGHSDADCLIHAIVDALLGAAGEGDIGTHFPDSDQRFKDMNSMFFLEQVMKILQEKGWTVQNVDTTIICEAPKIKTHAPAIRERLAKALAVTPAQVNVKGKTTEEMGALGRKEGIACMAAALLKKEVCTGVERDSTRNSI